MKMNEVILLNFVYDHEVATSREEVNSAIDKANKALLSSLLEGLPKKEELKHNSSTEEWIRIGKNQALLQVETYLKSKLGGSNE